MNFCKSRTIHNFLPATNLKNSVSFISNYAAMKSQRNWKTLGLVGPSSEINIQFSIYRRTWRVSSNIAFSLFQFNCV
ncbi:hypothetical protein HK096_007354 [Nowakowskiella sp. JEL0078]|nr:hypothetical protein HK096_007354 [Nowakowskiella sp. JEL0078]